MDLAEFLNLVRTVPTGPEHDCSYLPGLRARSRAFHADYLPGPFYQALMDQGFRRSGNVFYAMDCASCRACVPLRVPVATFAPSRSQRRAERRNHDVEVRFAPPRFGEAKWQLYQRYLAHQHPTTDPGTPEHLREFLFGAATDSLEATYHLGGELVGFSILDVTPSAASSVYHCYAPELAARSLGVFSALAEIAWAKRQGLTWYYLGFWIEGAATMAYKARFGPHELLLDGSWRPA